MSEPTKFKLTGLNLRSVYVITSSHLCLPQQGAPGGHGCVLPLPASLPMAVRANVCSAQEGPRADEVPGRHSVPLVLREHLLIE